MQSNDITFEFVKRVLNDGATSDGNTKYMLPQKGSKKAAGYDFYSAEYAIIAPGEIKYIKTGIKSKFPDDMALLLLNRSSNPKKKGLVLANGIGLVDADYYNNSDNEGEIAFAFMNITDKPIEINIKDKLGQGMFVKYFDVTNYNDEEVAQRKGGFGSSDE